MEPLGDSMMWTEDGDTVIGRFDGDLYEYLDPITERIVELIDLQLAIAQQERESAQSIYDGAFRLLVTSAAGVALLMVLGGWWVARRGSGPLGRLREAVGRVGRHSDVTVRGARPQQDEIGETA